MEQDDFEKLLQNIIGLKRDEINSVTIKQTSKGDFYADVKIYFKPNDISAEDAAVQQAIRIYGKLAEHGIKAMP